MSSPNDSTPTPQGQDAHASMIERVKNFVHSLGLNGLSTSLHEHATDTPHEDLIHYLVRSATGSSTTVAETTTPTDTTGSTTPTSIISGPERLQMRTPPPNFGAVIPGSIYRSSYPTVDHHEFLKEDLKIKSIMTLVPEPVAPEYQSFMDSAGIQHFQVHISANKGAVLVDSCAMSRALRLIMDRSNHPILVHCNKGKHRTGCTIAVFRRILGVDMDTVRDEYHTYAGKKARFLDEVFFENFDLNLVMWMARQERWAGALDHVAPPPSPPNTPKTDPLDFEIDAATNVREGLEMLSIAAPAAC